MSKLTGNKLVIIGADQNFDFLKIENNNNTLELLNTYLSSSIIPTINKPTRVTHSIANLIDNNKPNLDIYSGIIISDLSDHMPVFCFMNYHSHKHSIKIPLTFETRPLSKEFVIHLLQVLETINWNYLKSYSIEDAYNDFISKLNELMYMYIPKKRVTILARYIIKDPWMSKGLTTSSRTSTKLYHK